MNKAPKYRIRQNGTQGVYLTRQGLWGVWKEAAKFSTQEAAAKFAAQHNIGVYGLFTRRTNDWY